MNAFIWEEGTFKPGMEVTLGNTLRLVRVGGVKGVGKNYYEVEVGELELDLLDERVGGVTPRLCRPDHRVDRHPQPLLGAVSCVINRFPRGPADDKHIQIMRWRARPLQVARRPRAKDQHPLRPSQFRELIGDYLQRPPRQQQQLFSRRGVRKADTVPKIRISTAMTMNVYGRRKASRTIPIIAFSLVERSCRHTRRANRW